MAKNSKSVQSPAAQRMSKISSADPKQTSKYYHEALREAIKTVKAAEAQKKMK